MQEVLVELNRQNQAKQDFISPAQGMRLREDGHTFEINHLTTSQQEVFGTTTLFHRQVASALGIPAKYYDLMQAQKPELLAENVNAWFADKPSSYMVRSMDYGAGQVARALLSERYRRIDNMEIATAVLPLFAGNDQYEVMSCEVTENRLYLKVVNHRLEMEVRKGDIVQAGVMISNSEVGLGAVSIQPLVYRLVCTNGMVVNDMGERRHHVGRQAKAVEDIKTPFIVINADDYYGKEGFKAVHEYLVNGGKSCMAGFVLKNTLSDNGGVTRGICKMDENGNLTEVVETKNIVKTATGAEADGVVIDTESLVSMNMWGLTPDFLDVLEEGFKEFFEKEVPGNPLKAEYLIPIFIGEQLKGGKMSVKALKTNDTWYGMTYHEDVAAVKDSFKKTLENGVYKADLFSDL